LHTKLLFNTCNSEMDYRYFYAYKDINKRKVVFA